MQQIVKPISILFTFATMFGVLMHDMHIDRAAVAAATLPTALAAAGAADFLLKANHHTHVDRVSFDKDPNTQRSPLPKVQPSRERENDKHHAQSKRLVYSGGDSQSSIWPSV